MEVGQLVCVLGEQKQRALPFADVPAADWLLEPLSSPSLVVVS